MHFTWVHLVLFLSGAGIGGVVVWLVSWGRRAALLGKVAAADQFNAECRSRIEDFESRHRELSQQLERALLERAQLEERSRRVPVLENQLSEAESANTKLAAESAQLGATLETERRNSREAREQLVNQFEALASRILDEKSAKFTDQNRDSLNQLLMPFAEKITEFKSKVEEVYVNEGKDRSALAAHVGQLVQVSTKLSAEAENLALAIKGDRKVQGNWGEMILEDLLEQAGLIEGQHYERQSCATTDEGRRQFLDVVIRMPGDRHVVIDSKMTLPDYRVFVDAADPGEKEAALKRHVASVRKHVKILSEKKYQHLHGEKSPDFVVMFVPLEPAFILAATHDRELMHDAWKKNVILVSPSTLFPVLSIVSNMWRKENIAQNAKEIARRGAELYDKLAGFIEDLSEVGKRLNQAQRSYDDARRKLCHGQGNVVRQAEMLRELGAKPAKSMPADWVEDSAEEGVTNDSCELPKFGAA